MTWPRMMEKPSPILTFLIACAFLALTTAAQAAAPYWEDFAPQASTAIGSSDAEGTDVGRVWIADPAPHLTVLEGEYDLFGEPGMGELLGGIRGPEIGFGENVNRKVPRVSSGVTEPVPEPSTLWLLGTGLVLLGGRLRRKTS